MSLEICRQLVGREYVLSGFCAAPQNHWRSRESRAPSPRPVGPAAKPAPRCRRLGLGRPPQRRRPGRASSRRPRHAARLGQRPQIGFAENHRAYATPLVPPGRRLAPSPVLPAAVAQGCQRAGDEKKGGRQRTPGHNGRTTAQRPERQATIENNAGIPRSAARWPLAATRTGLLYRGLEREIFVATVLGGC